MPIATPTMSSPSTAGCPMRSIRLPIFAKMSSRPIDRNVNPTAPPASAANAAGAWASATSASTAGTARRARPHRRLRDRDDGERIGLLRIATWARGTDGLWPVGIGRRATPRDRGLQHAPAIQGSRQRRVGARGAREGQPGRFHRVAVAEHDHAKTGPCVLELADRRPRRGDRARIGRSAGRRRLPVGPVRRNARRRTVWTR